MTYTTEKKKRKKKYKRNSLRFKLLKKWHKLKAKWRYRFRLHKNHANCIHFDPEKENCKIGEYKAQMWDLYNDQREQYLGKPFPGKISHPNYDCCLKHKFSYTKTQRTIRRIWGPHN